MSIRCLILETLICWAFLSILLSHFSSNTKIVFLDGDYDYQNNDIPIKPSLYESPQKDYTRKHLRTNKVFPAILGYKKAATRDNRKVVESVPNNHIFICYSDHSTSSGLNVLRTKNASAAYKTLVFHLQLEACGSQGIFRGLRDGLNIYATTSASADENNIKNYCLGEMHRPPPGYQVCSGELIEDSDHHNRRTQYVLKEALQQPFRDLKLGKEKLLTYMGTNLENEKRFFLNIHPIEEPYSRGVGQPDADLLYYWITYLMGSEGSAKRIKAQKQLFKEMSRRLHVHDRMQVIGKLLFGENGPEVLKTVRADTRYDDFSCHKTLSRTFEKHCGSLSMTSLPLSIANICSAGIREEQMSKAVAQACVALPIKPWTYVLKGLGSLDIDFAA